MLESAWLERAMTELLQGEAKIVNWKSVSLNLTPSLYPAKQLLQVVFKEAHFQKGC
tara:strand:- start:719 stop:886 length:168 start_codon:yes stop_codon:yes gene_type:complete